MERKTISKKLRFEIFKRDRFTCQYCGRMAPEVILEVDHIKPVAEGGKNDILNLVTSCRNCNRGKGKTLLSDNTTIKAQQDRINDLADQKEQSDMMIAWKTELLRAREDQIESINKLIGTLTGLSLTDHGKKSIRKLFFRFSFIEIYEATEIAFTYYFDDSDSDYYRGKSFDYALSKIGGICYNKQKQKEMNQNEFDREI